MNLVTRFLAARRDKLLMKLGCWLVCFSLVLGLMLPQQKAEALVAELAIGSVAALAASYLCACGLPLVTQGMDRDALVSNVQRLIQEFLDTELGGITIQDWLGNVWDLAVIAGKLVMGRPLTEEFVSFAQWVAGKYAIQPGENIVYENSSLHAELADGSFLLVSEIRVDPRKLVSLGSKISANDLPLVFTTGYSLRLNSDGLLQFFTPDGIPIGAYSRYLPTEFYIAADPLTSLSSVCVISPDSTNYFLYFSGPTALTILGNYIGTSEFLGINHKEETPVYIPPGITAEQGIALDVGASATMDLDQVLQGVLDDVLAKALTSTMTAADEATENPPVEDEIADVDNLGLPALGQALTSRFPFSIPWDFFRAVQLLAAPAKAPYFEVDFMEPLADDVGGWQGDTTVILDFSEYAIIGQISRWTSTIGFCLMLAGATKRLIWTA